MDAEGLPADVKQVGDPRVVALQQSTTGPSAGSTARSAGEPEHVLGAVPHHRRLPVVHSPQGGRDAALVQDDERRGTRSAFTCSMDKGCDVGRSTTGAPNRDCRRSSRSARRPPCSRATTSRRAASRHMDVRRADYQRKATKRRRPTGECRPASRWVKADRLYPLVPRQLEPLDRPVSGPRGCEREFGRLKNEWAPSPLRVHGLDRMRLHAELTILAKLACALSRARAVSLAA